MTSERIDRRSWLREEIGYAESRLAAITVADGSPDGAVDMETLLTEMERTRIGEELERLRADLARTEIGAVRLRLSGRAVHGSSIEASALHAVVGDLEAIGTGFGAELLVGVPTPGSHIVELLPPTQQVLLDDGFASTADVLVESFRIAAHSDPDDRVAELAAELEPRVMTSLRHLVEHLVEHGLDVELQAEARARERTVRMGRASAGVLLRALRDVEHDVVSRQVQGEFHGALEGSGRFEIHVDGRTLRGTVPKSVRPQLRGLRIGDQVTAGVDEIVTRRRAGGERTSRLRLRSIATTTDPA